MQVLAVLRHEERVRLDPDPLVALYAALGQGGAEKVVCKAVDELAGRLSELLRFADEGQGTALVRSARLLIKVADQVGMATLARVAADLITATERGDFQSQAAILARIVRIGDRSLCAVWDLRAMTI